MRACNLTLHAPADFDAIVPTAGSASSDPVELTRMARGYGIEILGPPTSLEDVLRSR